MSSFCCRTHFRPQGSARLFFLPDQVHREQNEQAFRHVKFSQAEFINDVLNGPASVDEGEHVRIDVAQAPCRELFGVADHGLEDQVEARDFLLDEDPFVRAERARYLALRWNNWRY